jgi:hypothetical protein
MSESFFVLFFKKELLFVKRSKNSHSQNLGVRPMAGGWRFAIVMGVAFAAGGIAVTAAAEAPPLAQALSALDDAHGYLSETTNNKGGHPQKAMALIEQAEAELRAVTP